MTVCVGLHMYVCTYVRMYVRMYVCTHILRICSSKFDFMYSRHLDFKAAITLPIINCLYCFVIVYRLWEMLSEEFVRDCTIA